MNIQQTIALLIVTAATLYLGRSFIRSCRAFFSKRAGCGAGCGKCGFAPKEGAGAKPAANTRPNIIPLSDVRILPDRQSKHQP